MRGDAWPAALATLAWAAFGASLWAADGPGGAAGPVAWVALAGVPFGVSVAALARAPRAAATARLGSAVVLLLLLVGLTVSSTTSTSAGHAGLGVPIEVGRLLPGPAEAWAYVAALGLTLVAVGTSMPVALAVAIILALGAGAGGAALASKAAAATAGPMAGVGCAKDLTVDPQALHSIAVGELDGTSLGRVTLDRRADDGLVDVTFTTGFGQGRAQLDPSAVALERAALHPDRRLTAEDLGIDLVAGRATRHCRLVTDGRSAVQGFPALRWLIGENASTADPGAGLGEWRGTLDYWLVPSPSAPANPGTVVLATVSVDGPRLERMPPGLHATLGAAMWFGGP